MIKNLLSFILIMIDLKYLTELSTPITDVKSVYSFIGKKYQSNYSKYSIEPFARDKEIRKRFPQLIEFLHLNKEVVGISIPFYDKIPAIKFRSETSKEFYYLTLSKSIPYGIDLDNFYYGKPILLVEGEKDRDALLQFYDTIVSVQGTGLSSTIRDLICSITTCIFILFDNDEAGTIGAFKERKIIKSKYPDVSVEILKHPQGIKDSGTLFDYEYTNNFDYTNLYLYYQNLLKDL